MNPNSLHVAGKMQEWTSIEQRQKLVQEIEMAISQSGNPTMRSGLEIEEQIFQRARSKEDYFNLIARFILHLKEVTTSNNMGNVASSQKAMFPQVFNIGSSQQERDILSDSNIAGQSFPSQLINVSSIKSNVPASLSMQTATFSSGQQRMQSSEIAVPSSVQMASNLQLKQIQQRKMQNVQAQRTQPQQLVSATQILPQQQFRQQQNSQQQSVRGITSQTPPSSQISTATTQNKFLISAKHHQQPEQQQQQHQHQQQQQTKHQKQQQASTVQAKSQIHQKSPSPLVQQNSQSRQNVSPVASSIQVVRSPLMNQVSPCPPSNNPPSIGPPAQSPLGAADEVTYAEKLKDLVKYIEPLGSLINKMSKGEEHAAKRNKLLNIYEVFTNKRRVTLAFLSKCEQVVQTLLSVATPAPPSVSGYSYSAKSHTLQTVADNVIPHASNPKLITAAGHYINPVLKSISSQTVRHLKPSFTRKRKRICASKSKSIISPFPYELQLEMAHLWSKYSFTAEESFADESQFSTLRCTPKIDDVPNAPCVVLRIPDNYPNQSPEFVRSIPDESHFTHTVQSRFLRKLLKYELEQFQSITCILEAWEQSIKDSRLV